MSKIKDFTHHEGQSFVGWIYAGNAVRKTFLYEVYAVLLKSNKRVLVVELKKDRDNAVIFNPDGSEFCRIKNPDSQAVCFGDVFYINDELTLISRRSDASMLGVVIDEDGKIIRVYDAK